jgi:dihydrofolate synthase/folylpolyglutamate synthase
MTMSYSDALRRLFVFESRGIRLGIERTRAGLCYRDSPERGIPFVQVAGTNGKGSVASMIAASLTAAGYRTGLFTSPHLHRFVERIRIDGRPLGEREAARRIEELLGAFGAPAAPDVSFFEFVTVMAMEVFRDHGCDAGVLEVGLGGRLDSTTAVPTVLSVITGIALDHVKTLGGTTALIAREKAGILRRGVPLVAGRCDADARRVIAARARRLDAPAICLDRDFRPLSVSLAAAGSRFDVEVNGRLIRDIRLRLPGEHQTENAACAAAALTLLRQKKLRVPDAAIRKGLARTRWPGRLERVPGRPLFIFDAAHNVDGCRALSAYLEKFASSFDRRVLVFGAMADKNLRVMLKELSPHFHRIIYAQSLMRRSATCARLDRVRRGTRSRSVRDALSRARRAAGENGCVVVAGSIFMVAEAREQLLGLRTDSFIRM